jgi:hypothetical protein
MSAPGVRPASRAPAVPVPTLPVSVPTLALPSGAGAEARAFRRSPAPRARALVAGSAPRDLGHGVPPAREHCRQALVADEVRGADDHEGPRLACQQGGRRAPARSHRVRGWRRAVGATSPAVSARRRGARRRATGAPRTPRRGVARGMRPTRPHPTRRGEARGAASSWAHRCDDRRAANRRRGVKRIAPRELVVRRGGQPHAFEVSCLARPGSRCAQAAASLSHFCTCHIQKSWGSSTSTSPPTSSRRSLA